MLVRRVDISKLMNTLRANASFSMKAVVGKEAPEFTLWDENKENHSLSDYRGKWVLIYFYPKDDTPGCTKQACGFRDTHEAWEQSGVTILGISPDDEAAQARIAAAPGRALGEIGERRCRSRSPRVKRPEAPTG